METQTVSNEAKEILRGLSVKDKAKLLSQIVWETTNVQELNCGLSKFLLADGPAGIRLMKDYFDEDIYNTKPSTCYPSASTYASSWNRELLYKLGEHFGEESKQEGVDTILAPAVNIKRSPLGGRNFEYYSEDPYITAELATEFIKGIQSKGIGACLKHFAVNNQETRRMNINVVIDEESLHEVYLSAFEKPVKVGKPRMVMTAYNQVNGEYCASHPKLLSVLRDVWQYEGVVVTDCFASHDLGQGIRNGLTLQMPGESETRIVERVSELIENHDMTEEDLDKAVLINIAYALDARRNRVEHNSYDRENHHSFARQAAEESMVLLKNDNDLLPLSKEDKILVVGELAVNPRFQGGGSSHVNPYRLEIPFDEIKKLNHQVDFLGGYKILGTQKENNELKTQAVKAAKDYDKVVVFAGIPDLIESEGYDRTSIRMPQEQNDLIFELIKAHSHVVVVLANGSVVEMPWRDGVPAILESYLGGEASGSAIAHILFGDVNPSGKLAETFPLQLEDNPSYLYFPGNLHEVVYGEGRFVGYKYYDALNIPVLFPFGHGLSYTTFEYATNGKPVVDVENKTVNITVKNVGSRSGKEVVQVYVQRKVPARSIHPKKLVGFAKVEITPGEEREVTVKLDERTFMNYEVKNHGWETVNGEYVFSIGSSVTDTRIAETVEVHNMPMVISADSNIGDMVRVAGMYEKLEAAFQNHPESLKFLQLTKDDDPLKAISMGSLMTFNTLKRVDSTLLDSDITSIIESINNQNTKGSSE